MKNLLLIDNYVDNYIKIVNSIDISFVDVIIFDNQDTYLTIIEKIRKLPSSSPTESQKYNAIGILQHYYDLPLYQLTHQEKLSTVANIAVLEPELSSWAEYINFIKTLQTEFSVTYLDLLACSLYSNPNWKYIIDTIETTTQIIIRSSIDNTGSSSLGGNWFLETHTGVNLKTVYFTNEIDNYNGILKQPTRNGPNVSTKGFATGNVVSWGNTSYGATSTSVSTELSTEVVSLYSTNFAFAALKSNGSVVCWGSSSAGGINNTGVDLSSGVIAIYSTAAAFAAVKSNGSVVCWGDIAYGGRFTIYINSSSQTEVINGDVLSDVVAVYSTNAAFAALKTKY